MNQLCMQDQSTNYAGWLDNQDVMQILKISERTLRRRRMEGTIPSTRMGGKFLYKKSDIHAMLGQ